MTGIYFATSTLESEETDLAKENNEQDADTTAARDNKVEVLQVKAFGTDDVSKFSLSGEIRSNGRIDIRKTYDRGFGWDWAAWMTPFSMVGFWGHVHTDYGYFWL